MSLEGKDIVNAAKKQPLIFVCAGLIFVLLAFMYFRSGAIQELQEQVDDQSLVLRRNKTNITYSVQLDAQLRALTEINEQLKEGALRAENLAQNQQLFYRIEADTGVKLIDIQQRSVDPAPVKGPGPKTFVPIAFILTAEGDYRHILAFAKNIENGERISRVTGASLAVGGNNIPSLNLTVEMLGLRQ